MALIPPFFLDTVVAIGVRHLQEIYWCGTGFLIAYKTRTDPKDSTQNTYKTFLITNKHVIQNQDAICLRFNPNQESRTPTKDFDLPLTINDTPLAFGHPTPEIDVAVIPVNLNKLEEEERQFAYFTCNENVLTSEKMKEVGHCEGDGVYVLGFPMGLVDERPYVIVRGGIIAKINHLYHKRSKDFIIDAPVFPGNSGGPVVSKPELTSITGTSAINNANLIGIVTSYIPYADTAYSKQTNLPRITFIENSGLSIVVPTEYIIETIERYIENQK